MKKLAIIITHPIQYYVPVFQQLAKHCELTVFYTWGEEAVAEKFDPGFGQTINWDIPLLQGYPYHFPTNTATNKGSHHAKGIINPQLIAQIEELQPNAILVYGWLYHSHRKVMKHFAGKIPLWFRGDSTLLDEKPSWKNIFKKIYLKHIYQNIDKFFYVGQNNKAYFSKYGAKSNQLFFAPHAIDNARFESEKHKHNFKNDLQIPAQHKIILFAGKFEDKKNPIILLKAFLNLAQATPTHLVMVGDGPLKKQLKEMAKEHTNIHFLPFQNQSFMPSVYQMADVFCLPSQGPAETWGLALNEAMACAKAVIASNKVGAATDLIQNGQNGYIFESTNQTDLQNKLALALTSSLSMGQNAHASIQRWAIAKQVQTFCQQLYA